MGKEIYCDFCRKVVPAETLLRKVEIGGSFVGDACLNCASQLEMGLKRQIAELSKAHNASSVQPSVQAKVLNIPDSKSEESDEAAV